MDYYARRAAEYERIYDKPERQADLAALHERVPALLARRDVLEVACGTGYWTARVARAARSVLGVDANDEVLALARTKPYPDGRVQLERCDAYALDGIGRRFDGALAAFWWSHVPRRRIDEFLDGLHQSLAPGARVLLVDNRYVAGSSTPVARADADGDTWQRRWLDDGSSHEVLKNFPAGAELRSVLRPRAASLEIVELAYFWYAVYELPR